MMDRLLGYWRIDLEQTVAKDQVFQDVIRAVDEATKQRVTEGYRGILIEDREVASIATTCIQFLGRDEGGDEVDIMATFHIDGVKEGKRRGSDCLEVRFTSPQGEDEPDFSGELSIVLESEDRLLIYLRDDELESLRGVFVRLRP